MPDKVCALCYGTYLNLRQHLRASHTIPNRHEFALLIKYGSARRTADQLDCHLCGKKFFVRLDKHLLAFHGMKEFQEREAFIVQAKRLAIVREFKALRDSDPYPPMVSTLGLSIVSEDERAFEVSQSAELPRCSIPVATDSDVPTSNFAPVSVDDGIKPESASQGSAGSQLLSTSISGPLAVKSCDSMDKATKPSPDSSGPLSASSFPGAVLPSPASGTSPVSTSLTTVAPTSACENRSVTESQPGPSGLPSLRRQPKRSVNTASQTGPSDDKNSSSHACRCKCAELVGRVEMLEQELLRCKLGDSNARHSRASLQRTPQSAEKGEHVRKIAKKGTFYQKVIDDFMKFRLGPRTGRKDINNAQQAAGHCLRFCQYMMGGLPESSISLDLRFLARMDKLRNYPVYLKNKGYMPTTIRNMMTNVITFYKHIKNSFLQSSKLKAVDMNRILYEAKRLQAQIHKDVVVCQQKVKRMKTNNRLDSTQELAFLRAAKTTIPQLFQMLSDQKSQLNEHSKLMGYIMGYLCIISGHKSVVLTNMLKEHVSNAESWMDGKRFQILVDDHKTVRAFGQASLVLNATEFSWVKRLAQGKCCRSGRDCRHVFHSTLGGEIVNPVNFLSLAWSDAGCTGPVSFNMIQSSVATQANKHLTESERRKVARSMCHDPSTAENDTYKTWELRMKDLMLENKRGKARPDLPVDEFSSTPSETSAEDEVPIYDDDPDSSLNVSSEELRVMHKRRSRSKKKLCFSPPQLSPNEEAPPKIFSPSKIKVTVERLKPSISEYYHNKWRFTVDVPLDVQREPQLQDPPKALEELLPSSDTDSMSVDLSHTDDEFLPKATEEVPCTNESEPLFGTQEAKDDLNSQIDVEGKESPSSQEFLWLSESLSPTTRSCNSRPDSPIM